MKDVFMRMLEVGFILGILYLASGCQTVKGITGDGAWLLQKASDNITTK